MLGDQLSELSHVHIYIFELAQYIPGSVTNPSLCLHSSTPWYVVEPLS